MADPTGSVWAIVQAHLAGREAFQAAAVRIATILHDWAHELSSHAPTPSTGDPSLGGRPMWMSFTPVPTVPDADQPTVSKLFARAFELFQADEEGAA